jgi:hypothetical protein
MHVVASRHAVITSMPVAFVDVVTGVSGLVIVNDAFMNRGHLVPLRCRLEMNRGLFLLLGGLRRLLRCKPTVPRGGTLGLL